MNTTANATLACGASPVMAHAIEEVRDMVSLAGALVLNIGTLTPAIVDSMLAAGEHANELEIPVILDPVGAGATILRTNSAKKLINELTISVVRGNASEVLSLMKVESATKGVDSVHEVGEAVETAMKLAKQLEITIAITGEIDLVTDGETIYRVANGDAAMASVTGMGCAATSIIGSFLAVDNNPLTAAATALAYFGLAGEKAAETASGPGSFQVAFLDALANLGEKDVEDGVRISVQD